MIKNAVCALLLAFSCILSATQKASAQPGPEQAPPALRLDVLKAQIAPAHPMHSLLRLRLSNGTSDTFRLQDLEWDVSLAKKNLGFIGDCRVANALPKSTDVVSIRPGEVLDFEVDLAASVCTEYKWPDRRSFSEATIFWVAATWNPGARWMAAYSAHLPLTINTP